MSMRDRRDLERFTLDCVALVKVIGADAREPSETRVRDISASGAFVYMETSPEVGTKVDVELHMVIGGVQELLQVPGDVHVHVHGHVVRTEHKGAGVLFEHPLRFSPSEPVEGSESDIAGDEDAEEADRSGTTSVSNEEPNAMHPHRALMGEDLLHGSHGKF